MAKSTAMILILLGASFMSLVGLLMRLLDGADGLQILGLRSVTLAGVVVLVACLRRRIGPRAFLRTLDRDDLAMGLALAVAFTGYVFAMLNTTVASALFILSVSPICAAVLAWVWIGERPGRMTLSMMALAVVGVFVMVQGGVELGQTLGNSLAFVSAAAFALMLTLARRSKKDDVLGGTFLGGIFCLIFGIGASFWTGAGLTMSTWDFWLILFMGGCTIGIGIALVTWGTAYVPAGEVGLLVLIESVLGPIWVWAFVNEAMTAPEIIGGAIVLCAVSLQAISGMRSQLSTKTRSAGEIKTLN